jgi:hypothetical protein
MVMNLMGNYKNTNEHDLMADLIEEAIEQRGTYIRYIVRDMLNPDYLLGESSMSEFKEGYVLPMFVESVEHFNGNGDIFDRFGVSKVDSSIFQVGVRKFRIEVCDKAGIERPREGDLIYLSFSDSLWEIEKVKFDLKYYQMGKNYTYRLICKLFSYSHEKVNNPESDIAPLGKFENLDNDGLKRLLGIHPDRLIEEDKVIEEAIMPSKVIPSDPDTFGF